MTKKLFSVDEVILALAVAKLSKQYKKPINSAQVIRFLLNAYVFEISAFRDEPEDILLSGNYDQIRSFRLTLEP